MRYNLFKKTFFIGDNMKYKDIKTPEELLEYMSSNIKYGFMYKNGDACLDIRTVDWDIWHKECLVQTGKELLESNVGTCWDQVELERMWFIEHGYEIKTFFIWFDIDVENDLPSHTFLLYKNGDKWNWFENAFELRRGIREYTSIEDAIEDVKKYQVEFATKVFKVDEKLGKYLNSCEYKGIDKPTGVDDYLEHVTKQK